MNNVMIIYIVLFFAVLAGIDKVFGNKYGLGKKFDEGFMAMGNLALGIIGIYCIAPVIAKWLMFLISPLFEFLEIDPSIFIGSLLACDMGGYSSAIKLAHTKEMGLFSGLVIGSMLGCTIVYTIPVAIGIIKKEDQIFFTKGILAGIITIPLGALVSGIVAKMNPILVLKNLIPIVVFSAFLAIGLIKKPEKTMKSFYCFNKVIVLLGTVGLVAGILRKLTGIDIIHGMEPFEEGLKIVGNIAVFLAGAYPMMYVITNVFTKPLTAIGKKIGIGENSVAGLIVSLANNIPTFVMFKDMDNRGKVLCSAFAVSGAFSFGGQIGFVASVQSTMVTPVIIGKLVSGITAIIFAYFLTVGEDIKSSNCVTT
ncbi:ethanolamine utilization protein EutH [Clostridium sp. MB40-C1]|uniref:ethanolamine utilization protein EutH n=1 Tax=Clostridium sp. MB40-C1 TaxID=3070996 RepID=UPI0027E1940E|nr:ethanolamine utilization protein EutH [Clostridium sp. MB40-C1]WMJ79426.1 ethanolamine utilization protein EutH [Clostridium sp. MB40-C1]